LTWSSNADSCTAAGGDTVDGDGWDGKSIGTSGTFTASNLTTKGTYSYKLSCTSAGGATTNYVTAVMVAPSQSGGANIPLTGSPSSNGSTVHLLWNRPDAATCTLTNTNGDTVAQGNSGNAEVDATKQ